MMALTYVTVRGSENWRRRRGEKGNERLVCERLKPRNDEHLLRVKVTVQFHLTPR